LKPSELIRKRAVEMAGDAFDALIAAGATPKLGEKAVDRYAWVRHQTPWRVQESILEFIDLHLEGVWEDGKRIIEIDIDRDICLGYRIRDLRDALAFAISKGWKPPNDDSRSA